MLNVSFGMCVDLDCYHPKCLVAITSFPGNILSKETECELLCTCSGV